MLRAVLPVTQPPHSNPTTRVSTTTTTQDQNIAVLVGRTSLHRSARLRFRGIVSIAFLLRTVETSADIVRGRMKAR